MLVWNIIGLTAVVIAITMYCIKIYTNFLITDEQKIYNYRGEFIPGFAGVLFPITLLPIFLLIIIVATFDYFYLMILISLTSFFGLCGLLDDLSSEVDKGFIGHFSLFIKKGIITSGLVKASLGMMVGIFISLAITQNWGLHTLTDALTISLTANLINLLDVKPGRAAKGVIIWIIIFLIFKAEFETLILLYPITVMIAVFLSGDLQEHFMMGDTGANALGGLLGGITVIFMSFDAKILYLIFLIAVHVLTEFVPLSKIIEKSRILSLVDNLGRN